MWFTLDDVQRLPNPILASEKGYPTYFRVTTRLAFEEAKTIEELSDNLNKWQKGDCLSEGLLKNMRHELNAQIAYSGHEAVTRITDQIMKFIQQE